MAICLASVFYSCSPINLEQRTANVINSSTASPLYKPVQYRNDVPVRSFRQLLHLFPDADAIKWYTAAGKWKASFTTGTVETNMDFDAFGDWKRIDNIYAAPPPEVKEMISENFCDYHINHVVGILLPYDERHVKYIILITKNEQCKIIELYNGTISVFKELVLMPADSTSAQ